MIQDEMISEGFVFCSQIWLNKRNFKFNPNAFQTLKVLLQWYRYKSWLHQDLNEQCGLNVLRCNSFCHQGTMAFPSQIWGKGHQKLRWDWKNTGYKNHFVAKNCNYHLFKLSVMESISLHLLVLHSSSLASAIPMLDNGMGEKVSSSASYHHIHQNYHCHK